MNTPTPQLPTKACTMLVPIFAPKGVFFNEKREFAKSRKGVIFQAWVREIMKKGKILYAYRTCLFPKLELFMHKCIWTLTIH